MSNEDNMMFAQQVSMADSMPGCDQLDPEQPALCHAHCQDQQQSLDKAELPPISSALAIGFFITIVHPELFFPSTGPLAAFHLRESLIHPSLLESVASEFDTPSLLLIVATAQCGGEVDVANGKVILEHEAVKSLNWPAMTMGFTVKNKKLFKQLVVGKKVNIEFKQQGSDYVVTAVK